MKTCVKGIERIISENRAVHYYVWENIISHSLMIMLSYFGENKTLEVSLSDFDEKSFIKQLTDFYDDFINQIKNAPDFDSMKFELFNIYGEKLYQAKHSGDILDNIDDFDKIHDKEELKCQDCIKEIMMLREKELEEKGYPPILSCHLNGEFQHPNLTKKDVEYLNGN